LTDLQDSRDTRVRSTTLRHYDRISRLVGANLPSDLGFRRPRNNNSCTSANLEASAFLKMTTHRPHLEQLNTSSSACDQAIHGLWAGFSTTDGLASGRQAGAPIERRAARCRLNGEPDGCLHSERDQNIHHRQNRSNLVQTRSGSTFIMTSGTTKNFLTNMDQPRGERRAAAALLIDTTQRGHFSTSRRATANFLTLLRHPPNLVSSTRGFAGLLPGAFHSDEKDYRAFLQGIGVHPGSSSPSPPRGEGGVATNIASLIKRCPVDRPRPCWPGVG